MKVKIILSILFITFITGCGAEEAVEGQAQANPKIEMQAAIEMPHRSWMEELIDETAGSVAEQKKNAAFIFNDEIIVNYREVMELWDDSYYRDIGHDFEVENRVDDESVPKELIDILVATNNGNWWCNEGYRSYDDYIVKDYTSIDPDDETQMDGLDQLVTFHNENFYYDSLCEIKLVDIDYDGEYEYLAVATNYKAGYIIVVYDNIDGEIVYGDYHVWLHQSRLGVPELLEIGEKYYLLGDTYAGFYDPIAESWTDIVVDRYTTGYHMYEFYSNTQLEDEKIFEGVDLMGEEDWIELKEITDFLDQPNVLEHEIEGETYYYVLSDFTRHLPDDENDRVLFLIQKNDAGKYEIVKVYYLAADLKLVIEEKEVV